MYWGQSQWTYFFVSYNNQSFDLFQHQRRLIPYKVDNVNTQLGAPLQQPDSESALWLGGNSTLGCRCQLALTRFYLNLFVNDPELMTKFSGYETGNFEMLMRII